MDRENELLTRDSIVKRRGLEYVERMERGLFMSKLEYLPMPQKLAQLKTILELPLEAVALNDNDLQEEGAKVVAESLAKNNNMSLKALYLCSNHIGKEGCRAIGNAMKSNTTLKTLSLSYNGVGDGIDSIADALENNTTLHRLDLSFAWPSQSAVQNLMRSLGKNHTLKSLDLSHNRLGYDTVCTPDIANAIRNNTTLTSLNISGNDFMLKQFKQIADAALTNTSLKSFIALAGNYPDDETEEAVLKKWAQFPSQNRIRKQWAMEEQHKN